MPESRLSTLKRLWDSPRELADAPARAFMRVHLVNLLISLLSMVLIPAALVPGFLYRLPRLAAFGIFVLAVKTGSSAALQAFGVRWALHLGRWTGWKKVAIRRHERPGRFWAWTAVHAATGAIYAAAAVFLIWIGLDEMARP